MRVRIAALVVCAFLCAGCGGSGAGAPAPLAPQPSATPGVSTSGISISITVPASTPSGAARDASAVRRTSYISTASRSVVFTLDEPDIAQTDLRHRTVTKPVSPGVNTFVLDTPEGTVTLSASMTNPTFGELSYAAPMTVSVTEGQSTPLTMTFRPIVSQAWPQLIGAVQQFTMLLVAGPPIVECVGVDGQVALTGIDPAGQLIVGVGNFMDAKHNDVTLTLEGGVTGAPAAPDFTAGGVSVSLPGSNTATSIASGSFQQTLLNFAAWTPALKASASSGLVQPTILTLWNPANGPQCNVSSLG